MSSGLNQSQIAICVVLRVRRNKALHSKAAVNELESRRPKESTT
jgi:hypothetical protein